MAFLLKDGSYIKIENDGSFITYKNKAERDKEKSSINYQVVIDKYKSVIEDIQEKLYYSTDLFQKMRYNENLVSLEREYVSFYNDYRNSDTSHKYPIINKYFKEDVSNCIVKIVNRGKFDFAKSKEKNIYNIIKSSCPFEDATDC